MFLQKFVLHETQKLLYGAKQKTNKNKHFFPFYFVLVSWVLFRLGVKLKRHSSLKFPVKRRDHPMKRAQFGCVSGDWAELRPCLKGA